MPRSRGSKPPDWRVLVQRWRQGQRPRRGHRRGQYDDAPLLAEKRQRMAREHRLHRHLMRLLCEEDWKHWPYLPVRRGYEQGFLRSGFPGPRCWNVYLGSREYAKTTIAAGSFYEYHSAMEVLNNGWVPY